MITKFKNEYEFLSMDYPTKIIYNGFEFNNAETAFIASKCDNIKQQKKLSRLNAVSARKKKSSIPDNPVWEKKKDRELFNILKIKFSDPELKQKLIDTFPKKLMNNVSYNDPVYGIYLGKGSNKLGKYLMKLREELMPKEVKI